MAKSFCSAALPRRRQARAGKGAGFFVLVDGWSLVAGSLIQSYGSG